MEKNYLKEINAPEEVKDRNRKLESAFECIQTTIAKIQGWFEDETLRIFVISDFQNNPKYIATIKQITTRFCIITIGADELGRFSIAMSIDKNINEKIGEIFSATLIRRLFEMTQGALEAFVRIVSYSEDCDTILDEIIDEHKRGFAMHNLKINPMHPQK